MVPFKEMPDVLKVVKDVVKLKDRSWMRMKRTIYKDDLAQVEQVDMAQNQVLLKQKLSPLPSPFSIPFHHPFQVLFAVVYT